MGVSYHAVAMRYARALFTLPSLNHDESLKNLKKIEALLQDASAPFQEVYRLCTVAALPYPKRKHLWVLFLEQLNLDKITYDFCLLIFERKRLSHLNAIIRNYEVMVEHSKGICHITIKSAADLSEWDKESIKESSRYFFPQSKNFDYQFIVDAHLLGGIIIQSGSRQIDASYRTRLERMSKKMKGNN